MSEIIAVLKGVDSHNSPHVFILNEESILPIANIHNKGYIYLFPVAKKDHNKNCCDCGSEIKEIFDTIDEPATVKYACGKLTLKDYCDAVYIKCGKIQ